MRTLDYRRFEESSDPRVKAEVYVYKGEFVQSPDLCYILYDIRVVDFGDSGDHLIVSESSVEDNQGRNMEVLRLHVTGIKFDLMRGSSLSLRGRISRDSVYFATEGYEMPVEGERYSPNPPEIQDPSDFYGAKVEIRFKM